MSTYRHIIKARNRILHNVERLSPQCIKDLFFLFTGIPISVLKKRTDSLELYAVTNLDSLQRSQANLSNLLN